jgi:hypothetical protein
MKGLSVWATEMPIVYYYRRPDEHRDLENRLEVGAELSLFKNALTVRFPLTVQNVRRGSAWSRALWIYPEATYAVAASTRLGMAHANSFLVHTVEGIDPSMDSARDGVTQVVFQQTF